VRLTTGQNAIIPDVAEDHVAALLAEPLLKELSPAPSPWFHGLVACIGTDYYNLAQIETKGSVAKNLGCRSARVRRAHYCSQSVQMATLSRRHCHVVCALVSALPHLGGTDGRDDEGKRSGDQPQLCVALGANLWAGSTCPAPPRSARFVILPVKLCHCCPRQDRVVPRPAESKGLERGETGISDGGLLL
jgi:hypothetical protein